MRVVSDDLRLGLLLSDLLGLGLVLGLRFRIEFWVLGLGFWVLDFGFWVLGFGFWEVGFGFGEVGFGFWV